MIGVHGLTGERIQVHIDGRDLISVQPADFPIGDGELRLAPAFWDLQTNGRWGISYSDPSIDAEQVSKVVRAQARFGTARLCPTLITAPQADMVHGARAIAAACERDEVVGRMVLGLHLEGPSISERDGYRGAHPLASVRDPSWDEFRQIQEASGGRVVLVTLAPERRGAIEFIGRLVDAGIVVAIGHTAADGQMIREAVEAGAKLSTHLGNGVASPLARHPNPIWDQAGCDRLWASLIADGHHLDDATLRVLARAKGTGRVMLVSDASPLAGSPPGIYGEWEVTGSGKIVVAGTPYLAGAAAGIAEGIRTIMRAAGWSAAEAIAAATIRPAQLLGLPEPTIRAAEPANLIAYRCKEQFELVATCVDGTWTDC